jgi:hypothetical protein
LEEDDIERDMAGNYDWMFQTFQKVDGKKRQAATNSKLDENDKNDLIP